MKKILALSLCVANSSYVISSPTPGDATHNTLAIVNKHLFYGSRLNLSTDYQNKSRSFIFFDGFLPFSGDNNNIWFADVRFLNREQGASEGNVGLGYRHQMDTHPWIAGAYGFVDRRRSFDNNFFSELTVGGELKGVDWTLGTNFYVPVGQTVKADPYAFNATLTPAGAAGIYTINYNEGKEASLTGFDVEAGHAIPKVPGLMAYVGGYGYPSAHGVSSRVGPLVRAEYNLSDSGLLGEHPLMDSTVIEGFMRHDNFIGTSYYVGLKFGLNLDGTPRYDMDPIHRRMVDPVWRDIDLITASDAKKTPILDLKANGAPVTVAIASNYQQLHTYVNQGIDVVGVNGTINTTAGTIVMQNNQTLTGGGYEFIPGHTLPVGSNGALFSSANNQAIIRVSKNNSVEHLHFNMTGLMNGGHNANQAITNHPNPLLYKNMPQEPKNNAILLAQNSVGNLTITDNQLNNSGVDFLITDASKDSVFTINDNQLTLLNQARTVTDSFDINAINIQTTNNTHLRVAHLDRNQINLSILSAAKSNDPRSQYGASAVNIALRGQPLDAPSMTIESMQHNIINVSSKVKVDTFFASLGYTAVFLASGQSQFIEGPNVYTFALNKGSIHASHILNNQITMSHDENYSGAEGFNIQANHLNVEDVAHNQVIIATKGEQGIGMDFEGQDRIDVNHVTDNFLQINTLVPATLNYGFAGILIHPQLRTSQANVSNINHNYVEIPNASGTFGPSAGIELDMPTGFGFLNVTNVLNNHIVIKPFSNGSDSGRGLSPVGIYIGSPSCDHSDNTNTLTVQHINGNFVETKAVSVQTQPNALNYFNAILIQTTPSEPNEHLNNVLLKVSDISNNIIYTEIKGVAEKVRGIRINGDTTTTVEHIVNNTITLNAPQATTVAGISFFNGLTGFTNIPPQGLFETKNTSLNTIKLLGGGAVFGIATENLNVGLQTHYGLSNNNVSVVGPASTTYGFYFSAPSSFRTSPGHNLSGSITVTGIENNSFSLSPEGIGIYALAQLPLNKITFLPSLNHPELGLSVANGHTSYVRDGEGTITPTT